MANFHTESEEAIKKRRIREAAEDRRAEAKRKPGKKMHKKDRAATSSGDVKPTAQHGEKRKESGPAGTNNGAWGV